MANLDQPGVIPVGALHGRPSKSGDQARLREILRDLAMTPLQRVEKALGLGIAQLTWRAIPNTSIGGESQ